MDLLRFYFQFFHLNLTHLKWGFKLPSPQTPWHTFVKETPLPPRTLQESFRTLADAKEYFSEILEKEKSAGIQTLRAIDPQYPQEFKAYLDSKDCPLFLFSKGKHTLPSEQNLVAIVGTRDATDEGKNNARDFANFLALQNIFVCSGLAKGIDTEALEEHSRGAVAVLGGPLLPIYPACNKDLAEKIIAQEGTILSAYPLGQVPLPRNFPERNKLIAALSAGTIVIEGKEQSGAAITGKLSLEMGKTTVALTQNFRSAFGRGTIRLYESGATLVASEEEALLAIYSRFGGRALLPQRAPARTCFTLESYLKTNGLSLTQGIIALEKEILLGKISRVGAQKYRQNLPLSPVR